MKTRLFIFLFIVLTSFGLYKNKYLNYPSYFPYTVYKFENNILDSNKIKLGRVLFYDPVFSSNNSVSCASCHSPYNAFSHTDHDLSHGINDQIGTRNASALFNLAWQKDFMWDGAINHLDMQALAPISNSKEMNENIKNVVSKISNKSLYKKLFFKSFGDSIISGERTLKALAQFQLTLISCNSKYDKVKMGFDKLNNKEKNGYDIFLKQCNSCHTEPLFSSYKFANNGLPIDTTLNDYGKGVITMKSEDSLLFKIPSLRNLGFSYPYMHDGRFKTLHQVINHYNNGVIKHKTLSSELINFKTLRDNEVIDLITFLHTLNDSTFIFNKKNKYPLEYLSEMKD